MWEGMIIWIRVLILREIRVDWTGLDLTGGEILFFEWTIVS